MKKALSVFLVLSILFSFAACGSQPADSWNCENCGKQTTGSFCSSCGAPKPTEAGNTQKTEKENTTKEITTNHQPETIKASPDKYTWYMQDYVGKNAATIGYTSLGRDRYEKYGEGLIEIVYVSDDGTYVDIEDEDVLRQFVVKQQSIKPNAEIKLTFKKNSQGEEYSNLIAHQNYESIDLLVSRIDGIKYNNNTAFKITEISPSPDKYTFYVGNYVGKNVCSFGYTSLGGDRLIKFGEAYMKLILVPDDGSYLDLDDNDALSSYVVTSQSIAPNTPIELVFKKDSDGEEYDNLIESQNYEQLTLNVTKINTPPKEVPTTEPEKTTSVEAEQHQPVTGISLGETYTSIVLCSHEKENISCKTTQSMVLLRCHQIEKETRI